MVNVCTRNGSNGGSSGFTGRKDENGTLTCQLHIGEDMETMPWFKMLIKKKLEDSLVARKETKFIE